MIWPAMVRHTSMLEEAIVPEVRLRFWCFDIQWADMFAVAGLPALPNGGMNGTGAAGPNQILANEMGVIVSRSIISPASSFASLTLTPIIVVWNVSPRAYVAKHSGTCFVNTILSLLLTFHLCRRNGVITVKATGTIPPIKPSSTNFGTMVSSERNLTRHYTLSECAGTVTCHYLALIFLSSKVSSVINGISSVVLSGTTRSTRSLRSGVYIKKFKDTMIRME